MSFRQFKSRSPQTSKRRLFLTQEESLPFETVRTGQPEDIIPKPGDELSNLKKKYDLVKQENIKKSLLLDLLKGQVLELRSTAGNIQSEMRMFNEKTKHFEKEILNAEEKLNQELDLKKVYEHLLHRNKLEGTHLDIQVNKYTEGVRNARLKMDLESEKARRAKDMRFNTKSQLRELKVSLDEDMKKHIAHISNLEKNIVKRREVLKKYDEKQRRQKEIIELAVKQDRESHENELRERINTNKLLHDLLEEKEKKYRMAGQEVEKAFMDIKTKTGFTDPKEILNRFVNREKTHNKLIEEVEKAEVTLNTLQKEYHESRDKLKDFVLVNKRDEDNEEFSYYKTAINKKQKNLETAHEQKRRMEIVYSDVLKWVQKTSEYLEVDKKSDDLVESFELIGKKVAELVGLARKDLEVFHINLQGSLRKNTQDLITEIHRMKTDVKSNE